MDQTMHAYATSCHDSVWASHHLQARVFLGQGLGVIHVRPHGVKEHINLGEMEYILLSFAGTDFSELYIIHIWQVFIPQNVFKILI